jgi:hypothetical protein
MRAPSLPLSTRGTFYQSRQRPGNAGEPPNDVEGTDADTADIIALAAERIVAILDRIPVARLSPIDSQNTVPTRDRAANLMLWIQVPRTIRYQQL